ncbi:MAG TPA: sigma factor-like helix-turn-helix DNA-binding protein [Vicinamibacterales bacterium]
MQYRVVAADASSAQRQLLWDLCYRVTGTVEDADTLVRDCLAKAVERTQPDREADTRAHPIRSVAAPAMEALRTRKRRQYVGSWLPAPVETGNAASTGPRPDAASGTRYDMVESGTMAFLRALEALDSRERMVFVMTDAFRFQLQEAAAMLGFTSATTRTLLQNARRKMEAYDVAHVPPTADVQAHAMERLRDCLWHLQRFDAGRLEKTLAVDAYALFDSGGEFVAPPGSVFGASTIAKLLTKFLKGTGPISLTYRMLNGMPAAAAQSPGRPRWARRMVIRVELREDLVSELQVIMATAKLAAVRFDPI